MLIRADGGSAIGFGHLMRCLALMEEWMDRGGRCLWATTDEEVLKKVASPRTGLATAQIKVSPGSEEDARETSRLAEDWRADWVLADLYQIQPRYFQGAGKGESHWAILSDGPLEITARVDAVLSPGPQAVPDFFPGRAPDCDLLTGLDYTLLRKEIREGIFKAEPPDFCQNILVTFGGSDPEDLTWLILTAAHDNPALFRLNWRVILGGGYRGRCSPKPENFPHLKIEYICNASSMSVHYAWADLIVCSASTTLWEALYSGLPALVLPAAENQQGILVKMAEYPMVKCFPEAGQALTGWLQQLAEGLPSARQWIKESTGAGRSVIDGMGIQRCIDYFYSR